MPSEKPAVRIGHVSLSLASGQTCRPDVEGGLPDAFEIKKINIRKIAANLTD